MHMIKHRGIADYQTTHQAMLDHIAQKKDCEIWVLEHHSVYTRGKRSLPEHIKNPTTIPIIDTDRGGQVTYHGPGQMIVYPLIQIDKWHLSPSMLVTLLEDATINFLMKHGIQAYSNPQARGVYIQGKKIASIGLKIKQGYAYHGLALNINCDLFHFQQIVPCGDDAMEMTNLINYTPHIHDSHMTWCHLFIEKLMQNRYNSSIDKVT